MNVILFFFFVAFVFCGYELKEPTVYCYDEQSNCEDEGTEDVKFTLKDRNCYTFAGNNTKIYCVNVKSFEIFMCQDATCGVCDAEPISIVEYCEQVDLSLLSESYIGKEDRFKYCVLADSDCSIGDEAQKWSEVSMITLIIAIVMDFLFLPLGMITTIVGLVFCCIYCGYKNDW